MRTLHVIVPEPEGSIGGSEMHVRDLSAAQLVLGNTTPLVFENLSASFANRVRAAGVECVSAAGWGRWRTLMALRNLIIDRKIDVVHGHGYDGSWWAAAARALVHPRPALVITCHGWIETTAKLRLLTALDKAACRLASGVIVVSDDLVAPVLRLAARAVAFAIVPNGVPIVAKQSDGRIRRELGLPEAALLVGAIGRLSSEKRHDRFVEACALISAHRPDVHFVLAGGGPLRRQLLSYVADLGLDDRLHMVGITESPEALLYECKVVIQASDIETTSRVVLEAMAQARPVVATNVGGTATMIQDGITGILVDAGSPQLIATQVLRLLEDPILADQIGDAACLTARCHFDVRDMAAAVDDLYAATLGRTPQRPQTWQRLTKNNRGSDADRRNDL